MNTAEGAYWSPWKQGTSLWKIRYWTVY